MDRKTLLTLALIALITFAYLYFMKEAGVKREDHVPSPGEASQIDTSSVRTAESTQPSYQMAKLVTPDTAAAERLIKVQTQLYKAFFSTRGACLKSFVLRKFGHSGGQEEIQLIPEIGPKALEILFGDSSSPAFAVDVDSLILDNTTQTGTITFNCLLKDGTVITKKYTFHDREYHFDLGVQISGGKVLQSGGAYVLAWSSGLAPTEQDTREDLSYFQAYCMMGQQLWDIKKFRKEKESEIEVLQESNSGQTQWVATRTKYFLASLVPLSKHGSGFSALGKKWFVQDGQRKLEHKNIGVCLEMPLEKEGIVTDSFMVYVGPLDYHKLRQYKIGLENTVSLGWKIIRPFSIAILWIFVNLHRIIPNYGLVIIFFTILMKVVLHPLTFKSVKATSRMQQIQPKIAELREKHKDDTQRMNQEMMKLYKEQGVNPFGGCLPLLLQMPLFYGLFVVFRSTIELRGAEFVWWLKDLSQRDPYYILPLIMSVAMFWQQKITITDPKQKAMVYMMPILFFFLFKEFPSGLTLYWTLYNVLSLIEQYYLKGKPSTKVVTA